MSGASDARTTSISQWPGRDGSAIVISPILTSAAAAPEEKRQEMSRAGTWRIMTVRWVGNVVLSRSHQMALGQKLGTLTRHRGDVQCRCPGHNHIELCAPVVVIFPVLHFRCSVR